MGSTISVSVVSLEVLQVYDALVGYASGDSGVVDVELLGQAGSQIVGVHYGHLGSLAQSVRTEQLDVGVGDGGEQGAAVRSRCHCCHTVTAALGHYGMSGHIW